MSISKLESLPTEILIDLLEKYVNGVDVFFAFGNHLNSFFDAVVNQCQPQHFDFEEIAKKDFRRCINLLSNYCARIKSLTISERDAPGQMHIFLSVFPTFDQFKQLRRLRLHFDDHTIEHGPMINAIRSLWKTNIHTLSLEGAHARNLYQWNHIIEGIFTLKSVRRLFLGIDTDAYCWNLQQWTLFNIEHLTIKGEGCTWNNLKIIFKCAHRLSYLNVRVGRQSIIDKSFDMQPLTKLHTFILQFIGDYHPITLDMILVYLHMMPNLYNLEIIDTQARFLNANAWQNCIQTALLHLTWFSLTIDNKFVQIHDLQHALAAFQAPFWTEQKTFNIYVITYEHHLSNFGLNLMNYPESDRKSYLLLTIVPQRCEQESLLLTKNITNLYLSSKSFILMPLYCLSHIKYLTVNHLDSSLFRWIITHINLLNLTALIIPELEKKTNEINWLLAHAINISSLVVHYKQLFTEQSTSMAVYNSIRRLDISVVEHPFRKKDIVQLGRVFPSIKHLKINTINLDHIPLMNVYLLNLHSLTLKLVDALFQEFKYVLNQHADHRLLFGRTNDWTTIWIDQDTFGKPSQLSLLSALHQSNYERSLDSNKSKCVCS